MIMEVFRLTREPFAYSLSGIGAAIKGARWNSAGIEMIYTSANRSLAMAEVAVHLTLATLPKDFMMVTIEIPRNIKIKKLNAKKLPPLWNVFPHGVRTQKIGDAFVYENKYALMQVPSAVTQGDHNLLINPKHPEFSKIHIKKVEKFPFDNRIFPQE